ncbi:DNA-processing protein DprA [Deinococcus peraridilitoris]|uniref:DNA protecting protein DprA n=1 Tax=Deinococcus peraridilitoris (strain DSM 19664 / LMG 22246 / CIP 109416 / KR-200) TaxID=937777 RepID=L0A085_DEIPD|nr:DNA-processing protein DprA [Deinococcus peraridilitoris]AFZ67298.1 DNA protecting protein DprA [Deinococcus peraridilitoris DSM 19664]
MSLVTLLSAPPDELTALLALRFTPHLGPHRIETLRRHFGSAGAALSARKEELRQVPGLDARSVKEVGSASACERACLELQRARLAGVSLLGRGLEGYPAALEALTDPPAVLWVKGKLPPLGVVPRAVGIVGTRSASPFALNFTRRLTLDLARAEVMIISGLARGIDTAAHQAAIEGGVPTVGVLGSGVDNIYPKENKELSERMTVISEHPLGTRPAAHNFPGRNRIIAALSAGSVVVEGSARSGALITAVAALECGRSVFAVPGRPGDPLAAGPHQLLREGAALCENAGDVLTELGWSGAPPAPPPALPPELARVYGALSGPTLLDDLAATLGIPLSEVQTAVMMLCLQELVTECPGGRYLKR